MNQCLRLLGAVLVLAAAPPASAQDDDEDELLRAYGDPATVSIASGRAQPVRRAPAVATVITAAEIEAMGATDLDEVLEAVPGVHVIRGAPAYTPHYAIRGVFSQFTPQVLLLQNGIPMTTIYQGSKGGVWGGYPVEHIARVEVIRGPGSALHGADAYSGVINIVTKTAADARGTEVGWRAGSFDTRDAWVLHGGAIGPVEVAAYLRVGRSDGFRRVLDRDAQSNADQAFGSNASLAPGPVNTGREAVDGHLDLAHGDLRLRAGYKLRDQVGTGFGVGSALDPVGKAKSERVTADLSWSNARRARELTYGATASYLRYADTIATPFVLRPPGAVLPTGSFPDGMLGAPEKWERQVRLAAWAAWDGTAAHRLRGGVGYDDLDLYRIAEHKNFTFNSAGVPVPAGAYGDYTQTTPFIEPHRRRVAYAYAQDEWGFATDWTLTAGLRHDDFSDVGSTTNPRLSLVWDAAHDLTAKLLYGHAFRAPSFLELYSINNPVIRGNPELRPETVRTLEAALAWQAAARLQLNLSVFRYAMDDIIRAVPNSTPGTGNTFRNVGRQSGRGFEFEAAWDAARGLRLAGHYAWQRALDETTGEDAGFAPHHHLYLRADWQPAAGWLASAQLNRVADRKRPPGDARPDVPDYSSVDLTLRRRRGAGHWEWMATVRNAFDADVREAGPGQGGAATSDLPMAPRAVYVQLAYGF